AEDWVTDPAHAFALTPQERRFLVAGLEARDTEEQARSRRARRLRSLLATLVVLTLTVSGLSGYALYQRSRADRERDLALSRQLAESSLRLRGTDLSVAAQLAVLAYRTSPTTEARSALLDTSALPVATRLTGPGGPAAVALSPSSRLVAAVGEAGGLRLWVTAGTSPTGTPVPERAADLPGADPDTLTCVALSPDERILVAAGDSGTMHAWDISVPSRPRPLPDPTVPADPTGTVLALTFSPDGRTLAAAGTDGRIHRWEVTGTGLNPFGAPLAAPAGAVQALAYGPGGSVLAAGSTDHRVYLWDLADRTHPVPVGTPLAAATAAVTSLAFSADGRGLAAGSQDRRTYLWDFGRTGSVRDRAAAAALTPASVLGSARDQVNAVAYGPAGRTLAVAGSDHHLRLFDAASHTVLADLPHPGPVTGLAYAADGSFLVTGAADGIVRFWAVPAPSPTLPAAPIGTLGYAADGRLAATDPRTVRFFDLGRPFRPGPLTPVPSAPDGTRFTGAAALTPDGNTLAAAGPGGTLQLWDITGAPARRLAATPHPQRGTLSTVTIGPDGHLLAAAYDDGTVQIHDITDPARPAAVGGPLRLTGGPASAAAFTPDGHTLAAASGDPGTIVLYDLADPAHPELLAPPVTGPTSTVDALAFAPGGNLLAVGSADRTVQLLDTADRSHPRRLGNPLLGADGDINAVAFAPDGHTLSAACGDGTLRLWDTTRPARPTAVAVLTAAGDTTLTSTAFAPSGDQIAGAGAATTVRLWTLDPTRAAARICTKAGDPVAPAEWQRATPQATGGDVDAGFSGESAVPTWTQCRVPCLGQSVAGWPGRRRSAPGPRSGVHSSRSPCCPPSDCSGCPRS
ncbi:MAG: hypothetical protein P8Z68_07780, partial [Kineosporiaceae bacterium]